MPYCRSCGLYMSDTATVCPTCGVAVATTLAPAAAAAPVLVATFNTTTGWPGKTITCVDGRFTLEGFGATTARDVLAYDAKGQLDWANGGMRDWVAQLKARPPAPAMSLVDSQPTAPAPGNTRPTAPIARYERVAFLVLVLVVAATWVLSGMHHSQAYVRSPAGWLAMVSCFAFVVGRSFVKRR
jgi:hypothetical protein